MIDVQVTVYRILKSEIARIDIHESGKFEDSTLDLWEKPRPSHNKVYLLTDCSSIENPKCAVLSDNRWMNKGCSLEIENSLCIVGVDPG